MKCNNIMEDRVFVIICRRLEVCLEEGIFNLGIEGFVGIFQEEKYKNGLNQQRENCMKTWKNVKVRFLWGMVGKIGVYGYKVRWFRKNKG